MAIVGFSFKKIDVVKNENVKGKININNNVSIKDVTQSTLTFGNSEQPSLLFKFSFTTKYEPDVGHIMLEGELVYIGSEKIIKEVMDDWKKNKKVPDNVSGSVLSTILEKSNIQAMILARDINLPSPIPLPKIKQPDKPKK